MQIALQHACKNVVWKVREGQAVMKGHTLATLLADSPPMRSELLAPYSGYIHSIEKLTENTLLKK